MQADSNSMHGIQVKYGEVWADPHGNGREGSVAVLAEGDQIWSIQGRELYDPQNISKD